MDLHTYIQALLAQEEYSFSLEEIREQINNSDIAIKRQLDRLVEKKKVFNLRKGFYLILPPLYAKMGKLPLSLYADKMFSSLDKIYYVGLFSAARLHGAGHQQVQQDYIITPTPKLRDIQKGPYQIRFFTAQYWPTSHIIRTTSESRAYCISSPALTFADLIHHQSKIGGLSRSIATLEELSEAITDTDLESLVLWYPYRSTLQRMGLILDTIIGVPSLAEIVYKELIKGPFFPTTLSPLAERKPRYVQNRWKININIQLENDL
ncbi:type IV toxin-antitoxin system AbiEi family antitoxin [Pontibacter sp. G13]|uniref:type IV toxin-antitoxin system AbiEi family antitoxin domain-containing protein n=1 Tax=Pontibacter sp. G13 TaxID=3074898 RepID=UPI0028890AC5|nr:type IV toxin-antitoxin system AbiEi family antitoxin [Pontibacter sp. G13]WNJ20400.1 type IV toxin-antitoxin system AbiEi family antitoxin [Pontibacter sp. G13]